MYKVIDMSEPYEGYILKHDSNGNPFIPYAAVEFETKKDFEEFKSAMDKVRKLISKEKQTEICKKAINNFGEKQQLIKAIEECNELGTVLAQTFTKPDNVPISDILTEIADVEIMIQQLRIIFGNDAVEQYKEQKLKRLEGVVW